ncbi:MAG: hypothetical protein ABSA76_02385 [Bacteroidales bacterium]
MKKHFISLFDPSHRWWTIFFFALAILMIIASQLVGISDNLPGIAILLIGVILLFFAMLHTWRKWQNYLILIVVCVGILALEGLGIRILARLNKTEYINEGIGMIVAFFICLPGILAGIIGAIICAAREK